ncbi:MAG TPA: hypothetical protein VFH51_03175 [Myxococcota bacterium]|nr:hypothetical protein [Myxococcota bacterium]
MPVTATTQGVKTPTFWTRLNGPQRVALGIVALTAAATVVGAALGVYFDGRATPIVSPGGHSP